MKEFVQYRLDFIEEELNETRRGVERESPAEIVDGLVDICVLAIGALDVFGVDSYKAWNAVHNANMRKEVGQKESRPNPLKLPDLVKPKGWRGPSHKKNLGLFPGIYDK